MRGDDQDLPGFSSPGFSMHAPSKHPILIGLSGHAGAGKSTAANILVTQYGFTQIAFADPLKDMLRVIFRAYGMDEDTVERYINGSLKEEPCPALGGSSSRYAQQTLGTEWGRDRVNQKLWVTLAEARIERLLKQGITRIVVDDVRMANEAVAICGYSLECEAHIFRVAPEGTLKRHPPAHRSEYGLPMNIITADLMHDFTTGSLSAEIEAKIVRPFGLDKKGKWSNG